MNGAIYMTLTLLVSDISKLHIIMYLLLQKTYYKEHLTMIFKKSKSIIK